MGYLIRGFGDDISPLLFGVLIYGWIWRFLGSQTLEFGFICKICESALAVLFGY
jgi:hypothetical protein